MSTKENPTGRLVGAARVAPPAPATTPSEVAPWRPWFFTLEGRQFFYDDPESYPYTITEIAGALSNLCRFAGHLERPYSVAQHSILVAHEVARHSNDMRLVQAALLHDASEAFLVDIPRPLKRMPELSGYRAIERRVERAIYKRFGLDLEWCVDSDVIKRADMALLAAEKLALRPVCPFDQAEPPVDPADVTFEEWGATEARVTFVRTWMTYGGRL